MKLTLTKGLTKEEEQEVKGEFLSSLHFRKQVIKLLEEDIDSIQRAMRDLEGYDKASWAMYQADRLGQIRAYEKENNLPKTPIIAVTANAIKGDKEKFLSVGMDGYISKPINSEELKNIFNTFLVTKELIVEKPEVQKIEIPSLNDTVNIKIDEVKIANKLGINENIVRLIINKFKSEITKDLEELKGFIDKNDVEKKKQKAHYIKNSCLNVALDEACEILEQLEDKSLEESKRKELFTQLNSQLGNF